jgi:hypothetical protein
MPIPTIQQSFRGPKGASQYVRTDDIVEITFNKSGETYAFPRHEDNIYCLNDVNNIDSGEVFAQITRDKKKLQNIRPLVGTFYVKVKGFAKGENQPPAPKHYEGMGRKDDGTSFKYSYEGFTTLLEVERGNWKGVIIPTMMRYNFADAGDGESTGIKGTGKYSQQLSQFLEFAGIDFDADTIPLSENVLPFLEKTLTDRDNTFMVVVNDGYVTAFAPAPEAV